MSGNFPKPGSFLSGFSGISGKLGEKFSRNSPDATFSPWFTERFPENARKSRGKFPGEIFPSGSFPDFPKFSRREIFSAKFHHNINNKLYLYNGLQPVNSTFTKFMSWYFHGKLLQEKLFRENLSRRFPRKFRGNFPPGKVSSCFVKTQATPPGRNFMYSVYNTCTQHTFREHFYRKT